MGVNKKGALQCAFETHDPQMVLGIDHVGALKNCIGNVIDNEVERS